MQILEDDFKIKLFTHTNTFLIQNSQASRCMYPIRTFCSDVMDKDCPRFGLYHIYWVVLVLAAMCWFWDMAFVSLWHPDRLIFCVSILVLLYELSGLSQRLKNYKYIYLYIKNNSIT